MRSDTNKNIETLTSRYKTLKAATNMHHKKIAELKKKRNYNWRFIEIVNIDGWLTSTVHDVMDLRMDVEIFQYGIQADHEETVKNYIDTLLGNIVRLQDGLLSLQRINTHLYVRFSCYSAISIALLSLFLSFFSLISGYVFSPPSKPAPFISSQTPAAPSSAPAPNPSTQGH